MEHQRIDYRGHQIEAVFDGWKIIFPGGAYSPEKYRNPDDAKKSIDFDLNLKRKG